MHVTKSLCCKRLQTRERSQGIAFRDRNVTFADILRRPPWLPPCSAARAVIAKYMVESD
jgi:hypothetical protein